MTFNSNCDGEKTLQNFTAKKKKISYSVAETKKNGIVRYKLRIVGESQNEFISSNYDFFSKNCIFRSTNSEFFRKKQSASCEIQT